jgi:lipoate---protein ligase
MARMDWEIIERAAASAEENMEVDAKLLEELGARSRPILHLYGWARPSVTFGYFIKPEKVLDVEEAKRRGIEWARRPTGGGVVFHLWDLAFSVLVPAKSKLFSANTLENYRLINGVVQEMAQEWLGREVDLTPEDGGSCGNFCMAGPTKYDVVIAGKKIAGAAQRKTKEGFLHQGTIALVRPEEEILEAVVKDPMVREAMRQNSDYLCEDLSEGRKKATEFLKEKFVRL